MIAGSNGREQGDLQRVPAGIGPRLQQEDLVPDVPVAADAEDQFRHVGIARRLADLAVSARLPVNIAVYSPWGSGKSSLGSLLEDEIRRNHRNVAFVSYNAWKFAGESLRKNFISNAAEQLGFEDETKYSRFHRGLYQNQKRTSIQSSRMYTALWRNAGVFAVALISFALLAFLAIGAASTATGENFIGEVANTLPKYLGAATVGAFLGLIVKSAVDAGRVETEQTAPSQDEEFVRTFAALIEVARDPDRAPSEQGGGTRLRRRRRAPFDIRPTPNRIVFFIDELDRCAQEDVVETLVSIRTFLDQSHCVFIVAADRGALEQALDAKLKQARPADDEAPYYSTASAFLDKIFQHQLQLPPLRGRRLTRYARDLVSDRQSGVWRDLAATRDHGLDAVMYALIPSHVRSPRRVKVLLNAFATNARVAQARGFDAVGRAEELAKLTVLQVEFPALARDLYREPRLPSLLIAPEEEREGLGERSKALVDKHKLDGGGTDLDTYIPDEDDAHLTALRKRHVQLLERYLRRTARIQDPRLDLLFLEAPGAAVDLGDPELGDFVEIAAPDNPTEVVSRVRALEVDDQAGVVRLLASMVQDLFGQERDNVMEALMHLCDHLGPNLPLEAARDALHAVRLYQHERTLPDDQLVGAILLALRVGYETASDVITSLLGDDRLMGNASRLRAVAEHADLLTAEDRSDRLYPSIAEHASRQPSLLTRPVETLPTDAALEFLTDAAITGAATACLDETEADNVNLGEDFAAALIAAATSEQRGEAPDVVKRAIDLLLAALPAGYRTVRDEAWDAAQPLGVDFREHVVVGTWLYAPAEDWQLWSERVPTEPVAKDPDEDRAVVAVAASLISRAAPDDEITMAAAGRAARQLLSRLTTSPDDAPETLVTAFGQHLDQTPWAEAAPDVLQTRPASYEMGASAEQLGEAALRQVSERIAQDVQQAVAQMAPVPARRPGLAETVNPRFDAAARAVRGAATLLSEDALSRAAARLAELGPTEETVTTLAWTKVEVAAAARAAGLPYKDAPFMPAIIMLEQAAQAGGDSGMRAVAGWLGLGPSQEDVRRVLASVQSPTPGLVVDALGTWCTDAKRASRTALARWAMSQNPPPDWTGRIPDIDERPLVEQAKARLDDAPNHEERQRIVEGIAALSPTTPSGARALADAVIWLLSPARPKGDVQLALRLVRALPPTHQKKRDLTKAVRLAAERHDLSFSRDDVSALRSAGIDPPPQDFWTKSARKWLKALTGR